MQLLSELRIKRVSLASVSVVSGSKLLHHVYPRISVELMSLFAYHQESIEI